MCGIIGCSELAEFKDEYEKEFCLLCRQVALNNGHSEEDFEEIQND